MTVELAKKRLEYWMQKLDLYEHVECLDAAKTNARLRAVLKRLGYKIPKGLSPSRNKRTKYVTASDCWFPSYRGGKVAVTWHGKGKGITVWGEDDFGMEKSNADYSEFEEILASGTISQDILRKRGFVQA